MGKRLKELRTWQFLLSVGLLSVMIHMGVHFMNAGHSYEQAVPFRIFCACFAALAFVNLPPRDYLTLWSLLWLPVCYVATHIGYERHWIPDVCNYQFTDVIRLGKLVVLFWGWMLIAVLRRIRREQLLGAYLRRLSGAPLFPRVLLLLWSVYVIVITIVNPGYYYAIVFTLGFSVFFLICREPQTRRRIFYAYLCAMVLSLFFISYKSLRHRPYDTERYLLYFGNENMAGMYLGAMAAAFAALIDAGWRMHRGGLRRVVLIVLHLLCGWLGVLILFNYTRTYITGLVFALGIFFLLRMLRGKGRRGQIVLHFALPFLLVLLMAYPGYCVIRYVPAYFNQPTYFATEYDNETRIKPDDPIDSPKYTSFARFVTLSLGKWGISVHLDETYNPVEEGEDAESVSIERDRDVSNGRTYIWGLFLSRMTLRGHYPGHIIVDDDWLIYHAHNTYLQNMYHYGIPAGLLYIALIAWAYLTAIHGLRKSRRDTIEQVYPLIALGLMAFGMLTEWSGHPVYPFGLLLMMSLLCLLYADPAEERGKRRKREESR